MTQYTFDNRLFAAGNIFYEHDEDGFRSSREENGQTTHYRYSPNGRLLQAELPDGTVIRYRHHNGQRVAKLVNGRTTEAYLFENHKLAGCSKLVSARRKESSRSMRIFKYVRI